MASVSTTAVLDARSRREKHRDDLRLILDAFESDISRRLPKYADGVKKVVRQEVQRPFEAFLEKGESIRTSGRYTGEGERAELRLAAQAMLEHLSSTRSATAVKLTGQLTEQRAAVLKPKPAADPTLALLKELRHRELRDHLRTLDPLELQVRIRRAVEDGASVELLDALDGAPAGFSIAPKELVEQARVAIAERDHPELGELASLVRAYEYLIASATEAVKAASDDAGNAPITPVVDTRQPYTLSGAPLPGGTE